MANRNGAAFLPGALASIARQTLPDWELIVVDDASSDDSVAVVERAACADHRVRLVQLRHASGPAAARNRALALASGAWCAVCDSDDEMAPDRLRHLTTVGDATGADIVADNLTVFSEADPTGRPFVTGAWAASGRWVGLADYIDANRLYARLPDLGYLKPVFRVASLRRTPHRYDEGLRIGEDYDLMARLIADGLSLWFEPRALYRYRRHAGSTSYRSRADDFGALLAAHDSFALSAPRQRAVGAALRRRRRSLQTLLAREVAVSDARSGRLAKATLALVGRPGLWPLVGAALAARLTRFSRHADSLTGVVEAAAPES
jgi:succinoglycan biosynthesis protein ExoO